MTNPDTHNRRMTYPKTEAIEMIVKQALYKGDISIHTALKISFSS